MNGENQEQNNMQEQPITEEKVGKGKNKTIVILILTILIIIIAAITITFFINKDGKSEEKTKDDSELKKSPYWISSNSLEAFDLYFLQTENQEKNKVYSPLSIKYALEMLEDGTTGDSKEQIKSVIGEYKANKYTNSANMSLANAIFINNNYKDSIKSSYIDTLSEKYNADVQFDSFQSPDVVNSWINNKTLGLINNLVDDISSEKLLLINALGISMDWNEKFILYPNLGVIASYPYEKNCSWGAADDVKKGKFYNIDEDISGMEIAASFNKYDIIKELGEDKIKETVKNETLKYVKEYELNLTSYATYDDSMSYDEIDKLSDEEKMNMYLDHYIKSISGNYKKDYKTTEFSFYVDDNVKVFAKDLKEYNGTTLQYVGIMPTNQNLNNYIENITPKEINNYISNLKELKPENFKDGVVTKITGFIPKFKFEYDLNLMEDLKKLGINNVFESSKANLNNISTDASLFINGAKHKANIEFTQDGIKASAATIMGGRGGGGMVEYSFDVPIEEIDLTFDKPYMFIIRDKKSGESWFVGTVYTPLLYSQDTTIGRFQ